MAETARPRRGDGAATAPAGGTHLEDIATALWEAVARDDGDAIARTVGKRGIAAWWRRVGEKERNFLEVAVRLDRPLAALALVQGGCTMHSFEPLSLAAQLGHARVVAALLPHFPMHRVVAIRHAVRQGQLACALQLARASEGVLAQGRPCRILTFQDLPCFACSAWGVWNPCPVAECGSVAFSDGVVLTTEAAAQLDRAFAFFGEWAWWRRRVAVCGCWLA